MVEKPILKIVSFKNFIWNIKNLDVPVKTYNYVTKKIGSLITRIKEPVIIEDENIYKRITIMTKGQGIIVRDELKGKYITTKKQFYIHCGQLAVSRIDARKGAFGIIPKEAEKAIVTENFWIFSVHEDVILKEFFLLIMASSFFINKWHLISNGSGNRLYLNNELFQETQIPVPKLSVQKVLIKNYQEKIFLADKMEKRVAELEREIDRFIIQSLGIQEIHSEIEISPSLCFSEFSNLYDWDAKHAFSYTSPLFILRSNKYKNISILQVFEINPQTQIPKGIGEISFLPMECISDIYGTITKERKINASARGYTKIKDNDVIFAKITPCMQNGKCAVAKNLEKGYGLGSTEFYVFRATSKKVIPNYLHLLLRTMVLRRSAMNYFTGSSGQQRVSSDFIRNLYIPLPPVSIQEEIVLHVNKIKEQIKSLYSLSNNLRKQANDSFEKEIFGKSHN